MQKYENNIQDQFGNELKGNTITVRNVVGGAVASIFSDNGVTPKGNPFVASSSEFLFYAANGRYDIFITGPVTDSFLDVVLFDEANLAVGSNLIIAEKSAAAALVAGFGEFWVRDDVPNVPMFTDDLGTDFVLSTVGGGFNPADNQTITGDWTFQGMTVFDNSADDVELQPNVSVGWRNPADDSTSFLQNLAGRMQWGIAGSGFGSDFFDFSNSFANYRFSNELRMLDNISLEFGTGGAADHTMLFNGTNFIWSGPANSVALVSGFDQFRLAMTLGMTEQAAPDGDVGGVGQFWVRSSNPNRPTYTDNAGVDQLLDPSISEIVSVVASRNIVLTDKGKTIGFTGSTAAQTMTLPANGTIAFQIGSLVAFDNDGSVPISIAITTDTLIFADDGTTGTRTLAADGSAVAQKIGATRWKISGAQLS
jgi:hypothetical protein